jgi:hypothetical protein
MRVSIPAGATTVSMDWEFFNAEGGPQASYNDGMSVDVVDSAGNLKGNLLYVDTNSAADPTSTCGPTGAVAPAGYQTLSVALPLMGACDHLSIVVWNGGDNSVSSRAFIDSIVFNSSVAGCPVPCFAPGGAPLLAFTSPLGSGSLQVNMQAMPVSGSYFMALTLAPGTYPNGWFYGLDISLPELANQINAGWPFSGALNGPGCNAGTAQIGPIFGVPSGISIYAVALGVPGPGLSGSISAVTNSVAYTTP